MKWLFPFTALFISSCAQFTVEDKVILQIEECAQQKNDIPSTCQNKYAQHIFSGEFIEFRSKYIGNYVGNLTIEVKTGEKSIMCKTPLNDKNLEFLKAMKKGDIIKVQGTPIKSTTFKSSHHSYITLEPCIFLF